MPAELAPPFVILFLVALSATAVELRNALRPPECPQCVHCRHEAMARRERELREQRVATRSLWGVDERDDDHRPRR